MSADPVEPTELESQRERLADSGARADLTPLSRENLQRLFGVGTERRVQAGTLLAAAGDDVERVFIVRSGELHLAARTRPRGRHLVGIVQNLCVIGDTALLCEHAWPFDVLAARTSTVLEVAGGSFRELLRTPGKLGEQWATSIAKRLEETQRRHVALLTKDLRSRLATFLLQERRRGEDGGWVVRVTQQTIADLMGVQRQSVSRLLSELRQDGVIAARYGATVLEDLSGLADIAGEPTDVVPCIDHFLGWNPERQLDD